MSMYIIQYPIYTTHGTKGTACEQVTLYMYASSIYNARVVNTYRVKTYTELQVSKENRSCK